MKDLPNIMYYKIIIEIDHDYEVKQIQRYVDKNYGYSIKVKEIIEEKDDKELMKLLNKMENEGFTF
tara:strand:+ start:318 stop:515 length:198 start_codon:yes stop_codon:yes gene_type:complete